MTELLSRLFVRNWGDTQNPKVRQSYGNFTGIVGIIINILLFCGKFIVGTHTMRVSIRADAINNLSDVGSTVISLVSFKMSSKPADREHPFGHARIEYIASMLVSFWDGELAISGSVKARGGMYEILCRAEEVALGSGLLNTDDDYSVLCEERFRRLFACYTLSVGSTGNLGLSVGIMGASLGFCVAVYMSSDAKEWKKALLRGRGVTVIEHDGDYGTAVAEGRARALSDKTCFFIDDENSADLFYGYGAAAEHFAAQVRDAGIAVDEAHPLAVYLPCGVGTSPGGITYGLRRIYGENVYCFFCEPVDVPCMLPGMATGRHGDVSVYDIGLDGKTAADGLACAAPSKFVGKVMESVLRGIFTVKDDELFRCLALLPESEGLFCEPSACIGFAGAARLPKYIVPGIADGTQVVWTTGGSMVPDDERECYIEKGKKLL